MHEKNLIPLSGSVPAQIKPHFSSGVTLSVRIQWRELDMGEAISSPMIYDEVVLSEGERTFRSQKEAYEHIPPLETIQYRGQYVVSQDGRIVDHDADIQRLFTRFFGKHPNTPVYIGKVGDRIRLKVRSPLSFR